MNDAINQLKFTEQLRDTANRLEFIENSIRVFSDLIVDSKDMAVSKLFFLLSPIEQDITEAKEELIDFQSKNEAKENKWTGQ